MKKQARQYRQGDVFIVEVLSIPKQVKNIPLENGKIVLAHGEATGHTHAIDASKLAVFVVNEQTQERFLQLKGMATLRHEEHSEIQLPAGNWQVIRQQEYTPRAWRTVAD